MRLFLPFLLLFVTTTANAKPVPTVEESTVTVEPPMASTGPASCPGGTCVKTEDLDLFLKLLKQHKCRMDEAPKVTSDSVKIMVDRKGRVYGSGSGPKPYELQINWCNYQITAKSDIELQVAQRVEPKAGFRLRIKAVFGFLVADAFQAKEFQEVLDGGLLMELFYFHWANLNAYVGVRSLGAGLAADLTTNFGLYAGYSLTWTAWRSNPFVAVYFAF